MFSFHYRIIFDLALPAQVIHKQIKTEIEDISSINTSSININTIDQQQHWYKKIKHRWIFFRTVLQENRDLITGPAITTVPQLFSLPQIIFSSTMGCRHFGNTFVRSAFIISLFVLYIPQVSSFLLYVRSSSVYYTHFRSTFIGKKVIYLFNCCHQRTAQKHIYSKPSRYIISNTIKIENSFMTDNITRH